MKKLYGLGIESVLVEGGPKIHKSLLKEKLVDKIIVFKAKKKIKRGKKFPLNVKKIKWDSKKRLGSNLMLEKNFG